MPHASYLRAASSFISSSCKRLPILVVATNFITAGVVSRGPSSCLTRVGVLASGFLHSVIIVCRWSHYARQLHIMSYLSIRVYEQHSHHWLLSFFLIGFRNISITAYPNLSWKSTRALLVCSHRAASSRLWVPGMRL